MAWQPRCWPQGWLDWEQAAAFVLSGALLALADFTAGSARSRSLVLTIIALAAAMLGLVFLWVVPAYGRIPPLPFIPVAWNLPWFGFTVMTVILAGLAGLGRRLSGNTGKAAIAGMVLALPLALLAWLQGAYCHGWLIAAFAAVCGGFYLYNKRPAAVLPGIGGGMWLGFTPGLLAALSAETIGFALWLPALMAYGLVIGWLSHNDQKNA